MCISEMSISGSVRLSGVASFFTTVTLAAVRLALGLVGLSAASLVALAAAIYSSVGYLTMYLRDGCPYSSWTTLVVLAVPRMVDTA